MTTRTTTRIEALPDGTFAVWHVVHGWRTLVAIVERRADAERALAKFVQ